MADDTKDNNPDFEDEIFDESAFDESYYDDETDPIYDETVTPGEEDVAFDDSDFDEVDWEEEDQSMAAPERSAYRGGGKSFFSFNTIVILGAVLVGAGVLVFTVMDKSAQVASRVPEKFRSMLNIGEVMDGGLFNLGDDETAQTPQDQETAGDTVPAEGFLDNPDALELQATTTDGIPPQPMPISPTETEDDIPALTSMPDETIAIAEETDAGQTPRAPDEYDVASETGTADADAVTEDTSIDEPAEAAPTSAEDILRQAMASRGQKLAEEPGEEPAAPEPKLKEEEAAEQIPVVPVADAPKEEVPEEQEPPQSVSEEKADPIPVAAEKTAAAAPVVPDVRKEEIDALERKIDTLLSRMEQLESELDNVQDGRTKDYEELRNTVTVLKKDVGTLKAAPAPKTPEPAPEKPAARKTEPAPVAQPAPPKPVAAKPAPAPVKRTPPPTLRPAPEPEATAASWELRAAQPGKAWVSRKGQRDMQGVMVGETLPGIGRITAIRYEGGRWTVLGTQGQIRQ